MTNYDKFFQGLNLFIFQELFFDFEKTILSCSLLLLPCQNSNSLISIKNPPQFNGLLIKPFKLNAVVCLGIIYALKKLSIPGLSIKWPNDILSENKKIGGILIENFFNKSKIKASVIGVGLNLNQEKFEKLPKATSLKIITGEKWASKIILKTEPSLNFVFP